MKPEDNILYRVSVKPFRKRVWSLFAPYLILYIFLFSLAFLNPAGYKPIIHSWIVLTSIGASIMFLLCYKWALNKVTVITEIESGLEIEMMKKNEMKRCLVSRKNLRISTKRIGSRPSILKLTLLDGTKKITEVYAPSSFRELSEIEKLKYELKKYLGLI